MMFEALGRLIALLICTVGFPVHLLICFCIWVADRGPAIYRDRRTGQFENPFSMLKYRSMKVGCKPIVRAGSKLIVEKNDARVTPIGRILRCGIDELPQFANIVRGEMAWVGPRPVPVSVLHRYGPAIRGRFNLKPGITGLAQVLDSRHRSSACALAIDIWYKAHRTLWIDLWVIAVTPFYMAGWKSIGRHHLARLLESAEFRQLEQTCQEELGPGVGLLEPAATAVP